MSRLSATDTLLGVLPEDGARILAAEAVTRSRLAARVAWGALAQLCAAGVAAVETSDGWSWARRTHAKEAA